MLLPKPQEKQSIDLHDYSIRIIVAGSRYYNNRKEFHETLIDYLARFDKPILFISGAASTGADRLIIEWCQKFKYPCLEKPADWDTYKKAAGYIRNNKMLEIGTHLLCYWNGVSPGTKNMIEISNEKSIPVRIIKIV